VGDARANETGRVCCHGGGGIVRDKRKGGGERGVESWEGGGEVGGGGTTGKSHTEGLGMLDRSGGFNSRAPMERDPGMAATLT